MARPALSALLVGVAAAHGPAWDLLHRAHQTQPATLLEGPQHPTHHSRRDQQAPPVTPSPPNVAKWYALDEGVCVNGAPASVYAYHEPADKGTSNDWVIQLGGPPTLNWCIDEQHCAIFGVPPTKPPAPGTNQTLTPGGPFSTNCTDNPNWCHANMAQISMGCTMDLLMGANNHTVSPNHTATPFGNVSVLHFDGLRVLRSSIAKLLGLGLANASKVLLTGVAHGGTAVYLHADRIHAQIRAANPGLKRFGALPVDGLHPKHWTVLYMMFNNYADSWFTAALQALASMAFSPTTSPVLPGCAKANPGQEWKCLWVNESLPYIQSSVFAVNQMASVWDSQCILEGQAVDNVLQMGCSVNNHYERGYRTCNQYPEYCDPVFVKNVTAPYQQQYIDDYERSGLQKKPGNGGFFHSCYLGAYFHSGWAGTAIWSIIEIDGLSMRDAISNWWNEGKPAPPLRCTPPEHCPGGATCPASGVCPSPSAGKAAWTTDCTWDSASPEPPAWSNDTCADWTNGAPPKNTSGCPPPSCTLYSMCPRPPWTNRYLCNPSCGGIQVYY